MSIQQVSYHRLQKLTPIRGRKPASDLLSNAEVAFTETNPDKGTETLNKKNPNIEDIEQFTETNPDKGTETCHKNVIITHIYKFTETNPDKGTETQIHHRLYQI